MRSHVKYKAKLVSVAEAEAYEMALELCQELTQQHQRLTYNVAKLSELLTHQAKLWQKIGESAQPKPEYFRVVCRTFPVVERMLIILRRTLVISRI